MAEKKGKPVFESTGVPELDAIIERLLTHKGSTLTVEEMEKHGKNPKLKRYLENINPRVFATQSAAASERKKIRLVR